MTNSTSYFYEELSNKPSEKVRDFLNELSEYANQIKKIFYVIDSPLGDQKYSYSYKDSFILLSPEHKILIFDYGNNKEDFTEYLEDLLEDIGSISDKHKYKNSIGRPRKWRLDLVKEVQFDDIENIDSLNKYKIERNSDIDLVDKANQKRKLELIISLFIGSINDIDKIGVEEPNTPLDKIKHKIQLFDADQTRFIYQNLKKKRITIQGLSGTGKTELLLHKLKDLYMSDNESKIFFTCHNKVLANNLKGRIPQFFNFMRVEQQIEWNKRLWCTNAWGGTINKDSGAYRYICSFYEIPYSTFRRGGDSFSDLCKRAIKDIKQKYPKGEVPPALTYMLIDESQDFEEAFFELCELVTEQKVFIAGDVFQSIFDAKISPEISPDFLLSKCYRTDPKTLMFAHAFGMGLFEKPKIRWLEEKEWRDCGYLVKKENSNLILSREPIRRFEDLDDGMESLEVIETKAIVKEILRLITNLKSENQTITPDDIGIVFIDDSKKNYQTADELEFLIGDHFGWEVNKGYESKEKITNSVFITNKNNAKGLEFPFVICISSRIKNGLSYRNTVYTMLTRSFLKTFFLLETPLSESVKKGLAHIMNKKEMIIEEPSEKEKTEIRMRFKEQKNILNKDLKESLKSILEEMNITLDKDQETRLLNMAQTAEIENLEDLQNFARDNLKYICNEAP